MRRRLALLIGVGATWLFLAALPALADGGPHIAQVNSGASSLTADSCAGCHRAHTAQGQFLLAATSEEALCLSCHGSAGTGATANVQTGLQYVPSNVVGTPPSATNAYGTRTTTVLGALRDGGFEQAAINSASPMRLTYQRGWEDTPTNTLAALSERPKVGVLASAGAPAPIAVKSAHIDLTPSAGDGIADLGIAWGKGATGNGVAYTLTCTDCHNPHGNGNYRILNPVPGDTTGPIGAPTTISIAATHANFGTIVTSAQHGLVVGDTIEFSGSPGGLSNAPTEYTVAQVVNGFTFKVGTFNTGGSPTFATVTDTTGVGSVVRAEETVADSPPNPDGVSDPTQYPTKNYTILQTKGSQGVNGTYLLYARDVLNARTGGGVAVNQAAVSIASTTSSSSGGYATTSTNHGLAVGDRVTIAGSAAVADGTYTVSSVSVSGVYYLDRFSLAGVSFPTNASPGGTVVRLGLSGDYSATGGDYFHRTVPWNPVINNPGCDPTISAGSDQAVNQAACGVANDAPNGRPNAITAGAASVLGQQAFNDQITAWCSSCHTRYYSNTNARSGSLGPSSDLVSLVNTYATASGSSPANRIQGNVLGTTNTAYPIPAYGDQVTFSSMVDTALNSGTWYVIATGGSGNSAWFQVSSSLNGAAATLSDSTGVGTVTRTVQSSASSWWYPRNDAIFKYQHQTTTNRACTTCHVAHGSNAAMTGPNALAETYPGVTTTSTSSRLLKIDNRGTCQACHDPTGTSPAGQLLPGGSTPTVP